MSINKLALSWLDWVFWNPTSWQAGRGEDLHQLDTCFFNVYICSSAPMQAIDGISPLSGRRPDMFWLGENLEILSLYNLFCMHAKGMRCVCNVCLGSLIMVSQFFTILYLKLCCLVLHILPTHCCGLCRLYEDNDRSSKPWVEVISWEPRAFIYHNFLVL